MDVQYYLDTLIKLVVTVPLLLVYVRVSGKSQLAPATTFDQIGNMVVGAIGGTTLLNHNISVLDCVVFMSIWILILVFIRFLRANNAWLKTLIDGKRTLLMEDGVFLSENFKKLSLPITSIETVLHSSDINGFNEIRNMWLEPNGEITFDKKGDTRMSVLLVEDGLIDEVGLETLGHDHDWLENELKDQGCSDISEVFLAEYLEGKLWVYKHEK